VLAAKCEERADWRGVAALGVGAQELAALGEADGVEAKLEAGVSGELVADCCELDIDAAEEGGSAV
jgi:hypothetical protein